MRRFALCLAGIVLVLPFSPLVGSDAPDAKAARKIDNFTLKDTAGKAWSLSDEKERKATVVLFLGTECPINNACMPRLAELSREYADKHVTFVAINSNQQDTAERVAKHSAEYKIPFPVLKDEQNKVADLFDAKRTPEAFILDKDRVIRYQGRIDDRFGVGYKRNTPTRCDLVEALDEVLAGKSVTVARTEVAGCLISRAIKPASDATVTYAKQVSRLVQKNCLECHRPGQIGPMALETYDDVSAWSAMIREVVGEGRMPPWHADPKYGHFANDRRLSSEDRDTLLAWIEQGCPKGDEKDLPPKKEFTQGWRIGKPDAVFEMRQSFTVPATAPKRGIEYKYFGVETHYDEDRWIQAAEAKPGNRAVVHHIIVYVLNRADGRGKRREDGIGEGFLVPYAPGDMPAVFPAGCAKKLPRGATLVFQMHYTPNGTEGKDRSSVGLIFAKEPPKHEVQTRAVSQRNLVVPAGDYDYKVTSASTFRQDSELVSLLPHMHLRGKDFEYRVVYPDGKTETILSVPRYDFNWQASYRLAKPLSLPAGTRIECTAHFDNSAGNPNNPNPKEDVRWGEQTWQEMMIGFVDYVVAEKKDK